MTTVISRYSAPKGWMRDERFVYIGRDRHGKIGGHPDQPGYFGNLFRIGDEYLDTGRKLDRDAVLYFFRGWAKRRMDEDPVYREAVRSLAGKTLVCFCAGKKVLTASDPHVCHGQILAELADALTSKEDRTDD